GPLGGRPVFGRRERPECRSGHYRFHAAAVRASGPSGGADHCDWFCRPTISSTEPSPDDRRDMERPLLLYFSHRALSLLLCFKECLLDFTANADQPFFRMSGAVPKIVCLCLKFARSFFGCPQFGGKTVGKIHGSVAVCLRQIRRPLHQGDNPASRVIRHHSSIRGPLFGFERNNRSRCLVCLDAHHCFLSSNATPIQISS